MVGKVTIVGAGPGDPGLITVKGLRALQTADVIIHERLIPIELLNEAKSDAVIIEASIGPNSGHAREMDVHYMTTELYKEHALQGRTVVSLKGGDPFIFARGAEEIIFCHEHEIPVEVIPGISSVIGATMSAGMPLTYWKQTRSFTVLTGNSDPYNPNPTTPESARINYDALAHVHGTIVILMGLKRLPQICQRLIEGGASPDRPAAVIQQGTHANQRVVSGTLATLPQLVVEAGIESPGLIVIGDSVSHREKIVLNAKTVSVTAE